MTRRHRLAGPIRFVAVLAVALTACAAAVQQAGAADPAPSLRVVFSIAETSFDPQFASDAASDSVISNVYEAMLDYDYLARPVVLVPRTLEAMPTIEDAGRTYVCRIRKGIFFTPDRGVQGQAARADRGGSRLRAEAPARSRRQEPVAVAPRRQDRRRRRGARQGREVGPLRLRRAAAGHRGRRSLHAEDPPEGARPAFPVRAGGAEHRRRRARDGRRLRPRLRRASGRHRTVRRSASTSAARGSCSSRIPGTAQRRTRRRARSRRSRRRSPRRSRAGGCRSRRASRSASSRRGRRAGSPSSTASSICSSGCRPISSNRRSTDGKLKPELARKGIGHEVLLRPNTWFTYFNMKDPVVGGYTPDRIALRRAIGMAYDEDEQIRVLLKGRAVPAASPIPPDIAGYDPTLKTQAQLYDPAAARALLDRFGYKDRDGDGYREAPDGKPLVIERWSTPDSRDAAGRRAVEEEHGRDRHPDRVQEGQAAGAAQDGAAGQDPDARRRLERRLSGRREFHAAALRPERRAGEPGAVRSARNSTSSTTRRAGCPIRPSARGCSTG